MKTTVTLTEQGSSDDILVLQKRFFVSDSEVTQDDHTQITLIYAQCKLAILSGLHPTSKDESLNLAALQALVESGPFSPVTHKPGFLKYFLYFLYIII